MNDALTRFVPQAACADDGPAVAQLIRSISPTSLEHIYGTTTLMPYLLQAFAQDTGYFGLSRHRVVRTQGRCVAVIGGYALPEKWQLDLATVYSIFRFYKVVEGTRTLARLLASVKQKQKPEGCTYFLYNFAVAQAYRRKGIGQRLIADALEQAVHEGCANVQLEVEANNANALAFYTSQGFKTLGSTPQVHAGAFIHPKLIRLQLRLPFKPL